MHVEVLNAWLGGPRPSGGLRCSWVPDCACRASGMTAQTFSLKIDLGGLLKPRRRGASALRRRAGTSDDAPSPSGHAMRLCPMRVPGVLSGAEFVPEAGQAAAAEVLFALRH